MFADGVATESLSFIKIYVFESTSDSFPKRYLSTLPLDKRFPVPSAAQLLQLC